jgi:hypothetical protein
LFGKDFPATRGFSENVSAFSLLLSKGYSTYFSIDGTGKCSNVDLRDEHLIIVHRIITGVLSMQRGCQYIQRFLPDFNFLRSLIPYLSRHSKGLSGDSSLQKSLKRIDFPYSIEKGEMEGKTSETLREFLY